MNYDVLLIFLTVKPSLVNIKFIHLHRSQAKTIINENGFKYTYLLVDTTKVSNLCIDTNKFIIFIGLTLFCSKVNNMIKITFSSTHKQKNRYNKDINGSEVLVLVLWYSVGSII